MDNFFRCTTRDDRKVFGPSLIGWCQQDVHYGVHLGILNRAAGHVGVQVGMANVSTDRATGLSLAIAGNHVEFHMRGAQIAVLQNRAGWLRGGQLALMMNRAQDVKGVQLHAGVLTLAAGLAGLSQDRPLIPRNKDVLLFVIPTVGFLNDAGTVSGAQIRGLGEPSGVPQGPAAGRRQLGRRRSWRPNRPLQPRPPARGHSDRATQPPRGGFAIAPMASSGKRRVLRGSRTRPVPALAASAVVAIVAVVAVLAAGAGHAAAAGPCTVGLHWENDTGFSDARYTNGLQAEDRGCLFREGDAGYRLLGQIGRLLMGPAPESSGPEVTPPRQLHLGALIAQTFYTPRHISLTDPADFDHPYAGWLRVGITGTITEGDVRQRVELQVGPTGRWAMGKQVQDEWHDLIDTARAARWDQVVGGEPGVRLAWSGERHLAPGGALFGLALRKVGDFIPHVTVEVGNVLDRVMAGGTLRLGWLSQQFPYQGIPFDRDEDTGVDLYLYGRAQGIGVAYDAFVEGGMFESAFAGRREGMPPRRVLVDLEVGLALKLNRLELVVSDLSRSNQTTYGPWKLRHHRFRQIQLWFGTSL